MTKKCEHTRIDTEDGSLDKFCVRCSHKAKQTTAYMPIMQEVQASALPELSQPILRETITINTGKNALGSVPVYKDEIVTAINKPFTDRFSL